MTKINNKKKGPHFYFNMENFKLVLEVLVYVLFGPCYFSIFYFDSKLYFSHFNPYILRKERENHKKKLKSEKVLTTLFYICYFMIFFIMCKHYPFISQLKKS